MNPPPPLVVYLHPADFVALACRLAGVPVPVEVVFETDERGKLIRVQVIR